MSAVGLPRLAGPVLRSAWEAMSPAMRKTAVSPPAIPAIAARAKRIAAEHPELIRGDQGQVVGVLPEKEIYYGPSSGLPELRRLVGRFWTLAYGLQGREGIPAGGLGPEHVAVVSGATEGLAILFRMLAPGRKIGLQRLHWGNYRSLIAHAGGEHVLLDWFRPDGGLDLEGVAAAVDAQDLRLLIMNFPANPTGDVLLDSELEAVAALAREKDLVLVSDEVYNWVRYDDRPRSLLGFAPERTIVVGAASKEYLIPGARTGYVLCADETFANEWMPRLIRATSSSPNVLGQRATLDLLGPDVENLEAGRPPRLLARIKEELRLRLGRMSEVLTQAGFSIEGRFPEGPRGGISLLARLPEGFEDDAAFLDKAMELHRFSAIPGTAFGAPGCVRFGYAGLPLEAIERMREGLRVVLAATRGAMTVRSFEGKIPLIGAGTYVHPAAEVFGDVTIGEECWIGPGARIRGDYGTILIGNRSSVEDNCVIHARPDEVTRIGDWVTLGHGSIIHNATIGDWAIVGMGGIVSDWAIVGEWAVVAEGAVVRQGADIPERGIAVGVPARVIEKRVGDEYVEEWTRFKRVYVDLARRYPEGLGPAIG